MIVTGLVVILAFDLVHLDIVVYGKHLRFYDQYDPLQVARCEARCWNIKNRNKCIKTCLQKNSSKPGHCPTVDFVSNPFARSCSNIMCKHDGHCRDIQKCCLHLCGSTCQSPKDLADLQGIPGVPTKLVVIERRRKRSVQLKWIPSDSPPGAILYVIEARNYVGKYYNENRMSEWESLVRTSKHFVNVKRLIKPGSWYQFRVAAVNQNGTKGYSENSVQFSTSTAPKPPKLPQNITVGPLMQINGSITAEVQWKPPKSDLPIEKYKIYWSRRLDADAALDSVLVHQQVVPKDRTRFLLQNLLPNALYFLQIQAVSILHKTRLKGEKSGLVLNTTNFMRVNEFDKSMGKHTDHSGRIEGLELENIYWSQGELQARISWKNTDINKCYTITWWSSLCDTKTEESSTARDGFHLTLAATTQAKHFELYDLNFKCRYKVSVQEVTAEKTKSSKLETSVTFTTPTCKEMQKKYKELVCND